MELPKNRTRQQISADRHDCELFRLIGFMEDMAQEMGGTYMWDAVHNLRSARIVLRSLMHPDDRAATEY